jgi:hypothetical protein
MDNQISLFALYPIFLQKNPQSQILIFFLKWITYFNFFPFRALMITLFTFHIDDDDDV